MLHLFRLIRDRKTLCGWDDLFSGKGLECEAVFPMHYWDDPKVIDRFIAEYPKYKSRIRNTELAKGEKCGHTE